MLYHTVMYVRSVPKLLPLLEGNKTRGHRTALVKQQCSLGITKYKCSHKIATVWNKFSDDYVNASTVNVCIKLNRQQSHKARLNIPVHRQLLDSSSAKGFHNCVLSGICGLLKERASTRLLRTG